MKTLSFACSALCGDGKRWTAAKYGVAGRHSRTALSASRFQARRAGLMLLQFAASSGSLDRTDEDQDPAGSDDTPEMLQAAKAGDIERLGMLIEAGASPSEADGDGWSALMWAARSGEADAVTFLIQRGAEVDAGNKFKSTALHHAAHWGYENIVTILLDTLVQQKDGTTQELVDVRNQFGWTPLHWAGKAGMAEAAKVLLQSGADIKAKNLFGNTPLHEAINSGKLDVLEVMLAAIEKADASLVDEQNGEGETPIVSAAYLGCEPVVTILLQSGADVTIPDNNGFTPLHRAARGGHCEVVEVLLNNKASKGQLNLDAATLDNEVTALHEAARWGHVDVVEVLLEAGANPDKQNSAGESPLHSAVTWGRDWGSPDCADVLLDGGANPIVADKSGRTPLDVAADGLDHDELEDVEVYQLLQTAKSNIL